MGLDAKAHLELLTAAARAVQFKQQARDASGWHFALAAFMLVIALFRLPSPAGFAWLACGVALILAALYGMTSANLRSILVFRICMTLAVAAFSVLMAFRGLEGIGFLVAIFAIRLALSTWLALRACHSLQPAPADVQERVKNIFVIASKSDPAKTPGLIALLRAGGLRLLLPNDDAQYDYRLLFDRDLVFLIGINSFLGFRYAPRIRFIAPARTFHLEVVGESWGGKRSKVRLMLDNEAIFAPLEITPEMLLKTRQELGSLAVQQC